MSKSSYADVLCPDFGFSTGCEALKERGTLVRIGSNTGPVYEVVAVEGGTAWVREPRTFRNEALVPLHRLRLAEPLAA
ncbi:hypothetical protein [Sphingomonas lenta]|uniref:Uncharacterized protein n=1 Tax=Sphingomonas lenta TaxID=1141887 RepID=A0A2A2SJ55_9SPHN|nr:hypothetical protein [Sphingomonas lenta]PAX09255.1 hypothetical protein CKY28_00345 [Sphingomonas lenta]